MGISNQTSWQVKESEHKKYLRSNISIFFKKKFYVKPQKYLIFTP